MSDHAPSAVEVPTIVSGSTPAPAAAEPVASPAVETPTIVTPASAPVIEEPTAAVSHETPAATPAETPPTEEAKPEGEAKAAEPAEGAAEEKPAEPAGKPTLIEADASGEKKPDAEAKPAEGDKKPDDAPEAFKYETFKLPEGVQADEPAIAKFTEIIGPHKLDQETAQKLVDLHSEAMTAYAQKVATENQRVFDELADGWRAEIMADPVLGGAGHQTALQAAARMRDLLVPEEHRADFTNFMRYTRGGDHIAIFRIFHNAARLFDEPAPPAIAARPVPDRGGNGAQPRSAMMYDHPSSRRAAGR